MVAKAIILGNIGRKEYKQMKDGSSYMLKMSVATKNKFLDSKGNQQEIVTWHNVNFFSKLAETTNKFVEVGDLIYIEGDIRNVKIDDQNGSKWVYSVTGTNVKFLPQTKKKEAIDNQPKDIESPQILIDDIPF